MHVGERARLCDVGRRRRRRGVREVVYLPADAA
jgi:hypothetical protein